MSPVQFIANMENRMRYVQVRHYATLLQNQWWQKVASVQNISTGEELLSWILDTAKIRRLNKEGGNVKYSAMVTAKLAISSSFAGDSHEIERSRLEDLDSNGVTEAVSWAQQVTTHSAYWPQEEVARALKEGESNPEFVGFDGVQLFNVAHPLNFQDPDLGTYYNVFTGANAAPVHGPETYGTGAVTLEVGLQNLSRVVGYIRSIRSANGSTPLRLRPIMTICAPLLHPRMVQLSAAKIIAQGGGSGTAYGGGSDVEAVIRSLGLGEPVMAEELAGFENNTSFFIVCENVAMPEVSGLVWSNREAFQTNYYTGKGGAAGYIEAILNRTNRLEWHCQGRNGVFTGLPNLIFKVKAT
jgi:hypothetical protein